MRLSAFFLHSEYRLNKCRRKYRKTGHHVSSTRITGSLLRQVYILYLIFNGNISNLSHVALKYVKISNLSQHVALSYVKISNLSQHVALTFRNFASYI